MTKPISTQLNSRLLNDIDHLCDAPSGEAVINLMETITHHYRRGEMNAKQAMFSIQSAVHSNAFKKVAKGLEVDQMRNG